MIIERFVVKDFNPGEHVSQQTPEWAKRRPGIYTVLIIDGVRMMTDLFEEWWSQRAVIHESLTRGGNIFISGLGLGLVIDSILQPQGSKVSHVTVVEKNEYVIAMVGKPLLSKYRDRLKIIHHDIFDYQPYHYYDVVWHDIWSNPATIPADEIEDLLEKFSLFAGWQGVWNIDSYS